MAKPPEEIDQPKDEERDPYSEFEKDLEGLINSHSLENRTNNPDFLLARFLADQLRALEHLHRSYLHWSSPQEAKKPHEHPSPHSR